MIKLVVRRYSAGLNVVSGLRVVSAFFAGQGVVQLLNILAGVLLIRWLPVETYAQYSIAFAFQSTAQGLVEVGFPGAIIALVSSRIHNKEVIGNYIKASRHFRSRLFCVIGLLCVFIFPWMTQHHQWPTYVTVLLLIAVLCNTYFSGATSYYMAPLRIHRRMKDLYLVQVKTGIFRLLSISVLAFFSVLNAWLASFIACFVIWYNGRVFREKSARFVQEPLHADVQVRREMFNYVRPVMPGIIFTAFSAQISLFLIGIFGDVRNIAEVGALGRLGQIFFVFNAASSTIVLPLLARQPSHLIKQKYLTVLAAATGFSLAITALAFLFPEPLIWLIGHKYAHLRTEVGLMVLNSGIILLNVLMWDMNCSRKWLWPWIPAVSIGSNLLFQVIMILKFDLSTTYNVLIFSVIISLVNLLNKVAVAIVGFNKIKNEAHLLQSQ